MDKPKIDPSQIPEVERKLLCESLMEATLEFYSDPENEDRFQEWVREKRMRNET